MQRWIRTAAMVAGATAIGGAAGFGAAAAVWNRTTERMRARLDAGAAVAGPRAFEPSMLDGLPAPVARYFRFALMSGQPLVHAARVEHEGEFRTGLDAPWAPFRSVQHFAVDPPGFVWDARIRMAPVVGVRVRDSYIAGRAGMRGAIGGLIPVVDVSGTSALAAGALHRYLMERAWLPTSLLPVAGVRWEPVDDTTARASLTDAGITVTMTARFAADGALVRVEADRMRDVDGVGVPTPFVGEFGAYERVDGMMIPMQGAVAWILPEGRLDYWRGRITRAVYVFASNEGRRP